MWEHPSGDGKEALVFMALDLSRKSRSGIKGWVTWKHSREVIASRESQFPIKAGIKKQKEIENM